MDDLYAVVSDNFPVSQGPTLIVPRRSLTRFQELNSAEKSRLECAQTHLQQSLNPATEGFNLGVNDGKAAGQTIPQFHFHVIPRHGGDMADPRGGLFSSNISADIEYRIGESPDYFDWQSVQPRHDFVCALFFGRAVINSGSH